MEDRDRFAEQTTEVVVHERTYHAFSILTRWAMLLIGDAILTLTLWFATPTGFVGAIFIGLVAFVLGYWLLVHHEEKQPLDVWSDGR